MDEWKVDAACRGMDSNLFVPNRQRRPTLADGRREAKAKLVCGICTVRALCLESELDAMCDGAVSVGIFGGTNERERIDLLGFNPHYLSHHRRAS